MSSESTLVAEVATGSKAPSVAPCAHRMSSFARRRVRYREASIELVLEPGGRLRRFVVLASEKLRIALGQPRRREIEPLEAKQAHFELRTSELWSLGEHQALASLRLLYARLAEQAGASTRAQRPRLRALGERAPPEPAQETVRGELLYAGPTADGQFAIELLEDGRRVRSIQGLDLARALLVAGAKPRDTIVVERQAPHDVTIREETAGSHGEGHRTLKRGRDTFKITKESPIEAALNGVLSKRLRPSASSTPKAFIGE